QLSETVQIRTAKSTSAIPPSSQGSHFRDTANCVQARITKGSVTGSLMSASALPFAQYGISTAATSIAASGSRISGASLRAPRFAANSRNTLTAAHSALSNGAAKNPKSTGANNA